MKLVVSQSIAILPWIFGIFLLYMIMPKYFRINRGFTCLIIGSALLAGYCGLAAQIWLLDQLNFNAISSFLLVTTGIVFLVFLIAKSFFKETSIEIAENTTEYLYSPIFVLTLTLSLVVIGFTVHEHFLWPAVAWDTVWFWAVEANKFLLHIDSTEDITPFTTYGPHPKTLIYIMAWGGWSASIADPLRFAPLIPWLHLYLAIAISLFGFFLNKTKSLAISIVFTYIFLSAPLVEAHAIIAGYAELWIAFPIFLSIIFFCEFNKIKDNNLLFLALVTAVIPAFIKGVGSIYSISLFAIFLFTLVVNKWRGPSIFCFFGLLFLLTFSLHIVNIDFAAFGERFTINSSARLIAIGGREMFFAANEWSTVFYNLYVALFVKNSFGILFSIAAVSYMYLTFLLIFRKKIELFPQVGLFTLMSSIIIAALRHTDYFFNYSHPGNDTSLSRVCVILFLLGFTIIASAIDELSKMEKSDSQN